MEISVKGKNVDVGDALRGHAESQLQSSVTKYFEHALDSTVIFSKEGHGFRADISVHAGRGMVMQGGADGSDAYGAFDGALGRIDKQLRRYKSRIRNHHHSGPSDDELVLAQYSILASEGEEELPEAGEPTIVAEMPHKIATLTVSEAVMRMDLAQAPVMMFRNRAHGGLNVVYHREDGNIGWIDPSDAEKS
ncbi:MAG TPA: ribosome-associated translation inhibitor RaiA [Rhodospirillales bacterium]|jgi:ribosomal subunit interface protein|nr:ribosome-associated translation inhibitor RaiA [Rhodospirillales bacterium]|tara:strand:+ start:181 stop:756 length:576 start_codon:yes stop_codon:yes gene_type:complete